MIAMDSRPFLGIGLNGEDLGNEAVRFRRARRDLKECGESFEDILIPISINDVFAAESECKVVAKDFWSLGYDRWVVRSY